MAVKLLAPGCGGQAPGHLRDCLSRVRDLAHPALARTLDVVEDSESVVIVSELVEGEPLGRVLQRNVRMKPEVVLATLDALTAALMAAAKAGVAHGAIHPNEIIMAETGPKLTGVGMDGQLPESFEGTEEPSGRFSPYIYAAPERVGDAARVADQACDVFSLGTIAFHMLTGHAPYSAASVSELKLARLEGSLRWPRGAEDFIPVELILLVEEMCTPSAERRLTSYRELRSRIGLLRGRPVRKSVRREMPAALGEPEMAPAGPAPMGAQSAPAAQGGLAAKMAADLGHRRGPIIALISVAAFALVVALGFRQFLGGAGGRAEPEPPESGARETKVGEPAGARVAEAEPRAPEFRPEQFWRKRYMDLEALYAEDPAEAEPILKALDELATNPKASPYDIKADILRRRIRRREGEDGKSTFTRIAARAREREADLRYAEAVAAWEEFPESLRGTTWHEKKVTELDRLRAAIPAKYAEIDSRAQAYLARGELDAAKAEYARVAQRFGIDRWVKKAKTQIERVDLQKERAAAERVAAAEVARVGALRAGGRAAIAAAYGYANGFTYGRAIGSLDEALGKLKNELPQLRSRIERYREALKSEKWLFETVNERYESGEAQAGATMYSTGQSFAIRKLRPDGIVLVRDSGAGAMETRMGWDKLAPEEMYKVFSFGALEMSARERMALAVFCFHRGLLTEETNELTVASKLDALRAARVAELRSLFDELRKELGKTVGRRRANIKLNE